MLSTSTKGYLAVMTAALFWASSGTIAKSLFLSGVTPQELVQTRLFLASAILGVAFALFWRSLLRVRLRDLGVLVFLGAALMALTQFTYFYAISLIPVMPAILLQYLSPVFVAVFSMTLWRESVAAPKVLALALAVGGCYLAAGGYSLQLLEMNRTGVLVALLSAVSFAAYSLLGERSMHRYSPWTVVFYALLFAAISWQILLKPFGFLHASYDWRQWAAIVYIAVAGTIAPFGLLFVGIDYIRSTPAMITATLEPISAGFMAYLFLGETVEPLQIAGAGLAVGGIILLQLCREHDQLAPETIRRAKSVTESEAAR
jgi:drug/metabolite transporter (DMT)-like permease